MRDHLTEMPTVLPIVVTFAGDPARLAAYREYLRIDFPVLVDPERSLYRAVGAGRGSLLRVWSPGTMVMYASLLRRGRRLRRPKEDTRQLGADILVDATGVIRRVWLPARPDARPSIDELIAATAALDSSRQRPFPP